MTDDMRVDTNVYLYLLEQYDDEVKEDETGFLTLLGKCPYNESNGSASNDHVVQRFLLWISLQSDSVQRDVLMLMLEDHQEYLEEKFDIKIESLREKELSDSDWGEFFKKIEFTISKIILSHENNFITQKNLAFEIFMKSLEAFQMICDFMINILREYSNQLKSVIAKIKDEELPAIIKLFEDLPRSPSIEHLKTGVIGAAEALKEDSSLSIKDLVFLLSETRKEIDKNLGKYSETLNEGDKEKFANFNNNCIQHESNLAVGANAQIKINIIYKEITEIERQQKTSNHNAAHSQQSFFTSGLDQARMKTIENFEKFIDKVIGKPVDSELDKLVKENKSEYSADVSKIELNINNKVTKIYSYDKPKSAENANKLNANQSLK